MSRTASLAFGLICTVLALAAPPRAMAQPASLLLDINPEGRPDPGFEAVRGLKAAGDKLFFVSEARNGGAAVWASDGSVEGTSIVHASCSGSCSSSSEPVLLSALGGVMLWWERGEGDSGQLWRSDGTLGGTFALSPAPVGLSPVAPGTAGNTALFAGAFYFTVCDPPGVFGPCALWRTDGTVDGTRLVVSSPEAIGWLAASGSRLFFTAEDDTDWNLWSLTAGQAPPARLHAFSSNFFGPSDPVSSGGRLFFIGEETEGRELWTSDGTPAGTRALTRMADDFPFGSWLKAAGGGVVFSVETDAAGEELWRSDGTAAGTGPMTAFADERPFFDDEGEQVATMAGGRAVFLARTAEGEPAIWSSRGPLATTSRLPLCAGCRPVTYHPFVESGGKVYFRVEGGSRWDLWVTDGTAAGTRVLLPGCASANCSDGAPIPWHGGILVLRRHPAGDQVLYSEGTPGSTREWLRASGEFSPFGDSQFGHLKEVAELGGRPYFLASGPGSSALCRRTDSGTTAPVALIAPSRASSFPFLLTRLGDRLLFRANASDSGDWGLWVSSGTAQGTTRLTPPDFDARGIGELVPSGDLAFFVAEAGFDVYNLWRTDGTTEGTFVIAHLQDYAPLAATPGGLTFFDGGWIWRTDGTVAGTVKTGDLPPGIGLHAPQLTPQGLLFEGTANSGRSEVWRTDGTTAGTRQLSQFNGTVFSDWYLETAQLGGVAYFPGGGGLWRTDGTEAGTVKVIPAERPYGLVSLQGSLYYFTGDFQYRELRLWKTDGTLAGTVEVAVFPAQGQRPAPRLVTLGGRLYFSVDDGVHGRELWSTDGTPAGTALLRDLRPGAGGSSPSNLTAAAGALYFTAGDVAHGVELWRTDGTAAGTRLVQDIAPQISSSSPRDLTVVGDELYFVADDGLHGEEPWVLSLAGGPACRADSARLCLGGGRYAVEAIWRDHQGNEGVGRAVSLTSDTGYFWFFDPANVEAVLKVLDGRGVNGHVWTFYGALSDVEYSLTVTDTETGLAHRYVNPAGQMASVADTRSFGPQGANLATAPAVTTKAVAGSPLVLTDRRVVARAATGTCAPSSARLCLNGGRYSVEVAWKDFAGNTGTGQGVGLTADTGYFWFFNSANVELVLKVLDGSPVNGHRWVFYGALSSVEYTVTVTDTQTGEIKTYRNPSGNLASVADVEAF